jgi:flagellar export protein FliJ
MPFRFPLQSILHYRQSIEHQQELRLRAANQHVARVGHLIDQLDLHRNEMHAAQSGRLIAGVTSAELRFDLQCEAEILRHRSELEQQWIRLQQLRDQQREVFRVAKQARETLEGVRDLQLQSYKKEAARKEQRDLDDLFLLRRQFFDHG